MNVLNGACAVLAITSCAAGCATPAPASAPVRVTTTPADVAGCTLLGKVIVSDTAPDAAKEARDRRPRRQRAAEEKRAGVERECLSMPGCGALKG
jgi:hypothetical protein